MDMIVYGMGIVSYRVVWYGMEWIEYGLDRV
jgi:hypothetical protein